MDIIGIDFTSRPSRKKPITSLRCVLDEQAGELRAVRLEEWEDFNGFEEQLVRPGPWMAGMDFPFGQSRIFIEDIRWPREWVNYVGHVGSLSRTAFREALNSYRLSRPVGGKEHRRVTDKAAGSISPQKLFRVPVGLMFFEGAPRLLKSGVTVPGLRAGDPDRIVVEAYPGLLARQLIGRTSYKNDSAKLQRAEHVQARKVMLDKILAGAVSKEYGFRVDAPRSLVDDPSGDHLDALLCAIQAAWAWTARGQGYGRPSDYDPTEGWIADPTLL